MYRICKTEESAARQRMVEQCLLDLMKRKPYADISVGELAAEAGISRIAFYRYFKSKEGCLCALMDHVLIDMIHYSVPEESQDPTCDPFNLQLCAYWVHIKPFLDVLDTNSLLDLFMQRIIEHVRQDDAKRLRLTDGLSGDRFREDIVAFVVGGINIVLNYWYKNGFDRSIPEMAHLLEQLLNLQLSADLS